MNSCWNMPPDSDSSVTIRQKAWLLIALGSSPASAGGDAKNRTLTMAVNPRPRVSFCIGIHSSSGGEYRFNSPEPQTRLIPVRHSPGDIGSAKLHVGLDLGYQARLFVGRPLLANLLQRFVDLAAIEALKNTRQVRIDGSGWNQFAVFGRHIH